MLDTDFIFRERCDISESKHHLEAECVYYIKTISNAIKKACGYSKCNNDISWINFAEILQQGNGYRVVNDLVFSLSKYVTKNGKESQEQTLLKILRHDLKFASDRIPSIMACYSIRSKIVHHISNCEDLEEYLIAFLLICSGHRTCS